MINFKKKYINVNKIFFSTSYQQGKNQLNVDKSTKNKLINIFNSNNNKNIINNKKKEGNKNEINNKKRFIIRKFK